MSERRRAISRTLIGAVTLSGLATVLFFIWNTGLARTSATSDVIVDTEAAGPLSFAFIGLMTFVAIIFFTGTDRDEGQQAKPTGAPRGSLRLFARDPLIVVTSIGPLFGLCFSLAALLWRTFASEPGAPGTVWGDYTSSPLPFVVLCTATVASTNFGLAMAGVTVAVRNLTGPALWLVAGNVILGIGAGALFAWLSFANTVISAAITIPLAAVSAAALLGARRMAVSSAGEEKLSARARRRGPTPPPYDALDRDESVWLKIGNRNPRGAEFLLVTPSRLVHTRATASGSTEIIGEAAPNQVVGASTRVDRGHATAVVQLRARPEFRLHGTDPGEAAEFARRLTVLARSGILPD
ncbi:hypothetical protein [Brevibacterium sp. VCM10]|uniref:hypothetical protein n=1 Tax=Brevibacterium sp. VCM10 TaxID=1381751 RepID=UPI0004706465|nr:hypothetical protein [Brevibacterium sp. VCM10]